MSLLWSIKIEVGGKKRESDRWLHEESTLEVANEDGVGTKSQGVLVASRN